MKVNAVYFFAVPHMHLDLKQLVTLNRTSPVETFVSHYTDTCAVSLFESREQPYIKAVDKDNNNNNPLYVCFSPMSLGCDLRGGTVKAKVGHEELTMYCGRLGMKNSPCTVVDWA